MRRRSAKGLCRIVQRQTGDRAVPNTRDLNDRLSRVPESARQLFALICEHLQDSGGHNKIGCGVCGIVIREGATN